MKKLIITITILSFLNLIGCYYQEQMNPTDYTFNENEAMKIRTIDSVYNFNGDDYYLVNDTLFGKVSKKIDGKTTLKFNVQIPVEDMESVELERTDAAGTILTILAVPVGILVVLFIIWGISGFELS